MRVWKEINLPGTKRPGPAIPFFSLSRLDSNGTLNLQRITTLMGIPCEDLEDAFARIQVRYELKTPWLS